MVVAVSASSMALVVHFIPAFVVPVMIFAAVRGRLHAAAIFEFKEVRVPLVELSIFIVSLICLISVAPTASVTSTALTLVVLTTLIPVVFGSKPVARV